MPNSNNKREVYYMRIRSQIAFVTISMILIAAIVGIGIYTNGTKRLRKLEKTVQATWGDVEWRLEERNKFLPSFTEVVKPYLASDPAILDAVLDEIDRLEGWRKKDNADQIMRAARELDKKVSRLLKTLKGSAEAQADPKCKGARQRLGEITDRITSDRRQYNEAVTKFNRFLSGFPGYLLGSQHVPKTYFADQ